MTNPRVLIATLFLFASCARIASAAQNDNYFARIDAVPLAVAVRVDKVDERAEGRLVIYRLTVTEVLKGSSPPDTLQVVQELVFPSDKPLLGRRDERVLLLEPLVLNSRLESLLPEGQYFRINQGADGARPARVSTRIRKYLASFQKPVSERTPERLAVLTLALRDADLAGDAAAALTATANLDKQLSDAHIAGIAAALADRNLSLEQRRVLLDIIGEDRIVRLKPAVSALLSETALAPFARRTLAALGESITVETLQADLSAGDPAARIAALHTASALPVSDRLDVLTKTALADSDHDVRVAAIKQLGQVGAPAIPNLTGLLTDTDQRICYFATQGLADIGTDEAVAALVRQFDGDNYEAQVAAVFALRRVGNQAAMEELTKVRAQPPDPRLVKVIDIATQRSISHHE